MSMYAIIRVLRGAFFTLPSPNNLARCRFTWRRLTCRWPGWAASSDSVRGTFIQCQRGSRLCWRSSKRYWWMGAGWWCSRADGSTPACTRFRYFVWFQSRHWKGVQPSKRSKLAPTNGPRGTLPERTSSALPLSETSRWSWLNSSDGASGCYFAGIRGTTASSRSEWE